MSFHLSVHLKLKFKSITFDENVMKLIHFIDILVYQLY